MLFWVWGVKSPLALSEKEMEMLSGDAIEASQMALGLVPEVLNSVDVLVLFREAFAVIDPVMAET